MFSYGTFTVLMLALISINFNWAQSASLSRDGSLKMQLNEQSPRRVRRSTESTFARILTQQGISPTDKALRQNFSRITTLLKQRYGDNAVALCITKYGRGKVFIRNRRSIRKFIHNCRRLFKWKDSKLIFMNGRFSNFCCVVKAENYIQQSWNGIEESYKLELYVENIWWRLDGGYSKDS